MIEIKLRVDIFTDDEGKFLYTIHADDYPEFTPGTCGRYHDSFEEAQDCAIHMMPEFSIAVTQWLEERRRKAH